MTNLKLVRALSIILCAFVGLNAIVAGTLFITDPTGTSMGMSVAYLQYSPFTSYLIPGIVLCSCIGIFGIAVTVALWKKTPSAARIVIIHGILLIGWIVVQMMFVRDINPLHITMILFGTAIVWLGWKLHRSLPL